MFLRDRSGSFRLLHLGWFVWFEAFGFAHFGLFVWVK